MADVIDMKLVKKTQDSLGSVIKRPPLHDRLLKKPPFRFLHDIITNVIKTTGFMKGLYTQEEMISSNIKDKEAKIAFLQKAIDTVVFTLGQSLSVKPSKIVAGHEPDKTNELLQAIAKAVIDKMDSKEAVQKVLRGEKPGKNLKKGKRDPGSSNKVAETAKPKSTKVPESLHANGETTSQGTGTENAEDSIAEGMLASAPPEVTKDEVPTSEPPLTEEESNQEKNEVSDIVDTWKSSSSHRPKSRLSSQMSSRSDRLSPRAKSQLSGSDDSGIMENGGINESLDALSVGNDEQIPMVMPLGSTPSVTEFRTGKLETETATSISSANADFSIVQGDKGIASNGTPDSLILNLNSDLNTGRENFSARPKSGQMSVRSVRTARPTSARPAPPKIKKRVIMESEEQVRLMSAKPVSNLILDSGSHSDEEESFVVEEAPPPTPEDNQVSQKPPEPLEDEQKGSLVKQLLETKKDLEGGSQQNKQCRVERDNSQISEVTRKKERESASRELSRLKLGIQTLSRYANPLGKMLDFLQEDIDSMQQEWHKWQQEFQENLQVLKREQSATDSILEPLHRQLEELDQAILDQLEQIGTIKAKIFHNDDRIKKLLAGLAKY